ncbi:MAG: MarR family winged helix-turn-helix transcriptional regulator [Oligoflexales bacterium]
MTTFAVLESFLALRRTIALLRAAETKGIEFGHNQIAVLYKLSLANATMSELVEYTYSDKAAMTRTVASLEKMGFVKRLVNEEDRRSAIVALTPKGKNRADIALEIRNAIGKKLDGCLTPGEREQFLSLVKKIGRNLK